jgi:hypothetical protein
MTLPWYATGERNVSVRKRDHVVVWFVVAVVLAVIVLW